MTYTPSTIAEKGERIYRDKFKSQYESTSNGKFIAIDIESAAGFVADTPEDALQEAKKANPRGAFHLIKIGSPGVFRVAYSGVQSGGWIFQQ